MALITFGLRCPQHVSDPLCLPRPQMRSPDLPRALQKCFAVACLGPGSGTAAEEKYGTLPFCSGSLSSLTLRGSFRSQELGCRDDSGTRLRSYFLPDLLLPNARSATSDSRTPACATSFVATSGPLLMHKVAWGTEHTSRGRVGGTVVKGALNPRCCRESAHVLYVFLGSVPLVSNERCECKICICFLCQEPT